jgi:hypothetical protein
MMKNLNISQAVSKKLRDKHGVTRREVEQCFLNRTGRLLVDDRALTRTNPPTLWFLAPTNHGRLLKIVYIHIGGRVELKTAYEPNDTELDIYKKKGL